MRAPEMTSGPVAAISLSKGDKLRWGLLVFWTLVMVYLIAVFDPTTNRYVYGLSKLSQSLGLSPFAPAKAFHFFSYMLWAILALGALTGGYFKKPGAYATVLFVIGGLGYIIGPEALQLLNAARSPSIADVLLNGAGLLMGAVVVVLVAHFGPRRPFFSRFFITKPEQQGL